MSCGIYCITNVNNDKKYIGQSKNIEGRWKEHINGLNKGKHGNSHLQNAWKTYGAIGFTFAIIEYCEVEELTEREDYWMKHYNCLDRKFGYNLREAGSSGVFREESRIKMSEAQKGKWVGEDNSSSKITEAQALNVIELLLSGKSVYSIEKKLGIPHRTIRHIKNKENWTHLTEGIEFPCLESSKYKGVSYEKSGNKWRANVSFEKKRVYLEYFDDEIEAAKARDVKALEYFGDKAKLNFPQ